MHRLAILAAALVGCGDSTPADSDGTDNGPLQPLQMDSSDVHVEWAVDRTHEAACGGGEIAGGTTAGSAVFKQIGNSTIEASAAWDVGNLKYQPEHNPVGPAGGPVAPVLGPDQYPHAFHFDPVTDACGNGPVATGKVVIAADTGDEIHGDVQGGEAHRLDFSLPGDGVESFVVVKITGGTGRYSYETGSFTLHTIIRFDATTDRFEVDLAETIP